MRPTVLVVEDDVKIAAFVAKNLEAAGFACVPVHHGGEAVAEFERSQPALVVLDLMLPGMDGLEVTRRLRERSSVPILLLTARSGEADKVLGFEVGADDYLTKPFSTRELVARVRALLRRSGGNLPGETIVRGSLRIDVERRAVEAGGSPVRLTSLEFDALAFLAARPGRVYTRESLMEHVWGDERFLDTRSIDSLISRLRRKLERDPSHPAYVQTVWGAGYRFAEDPP